MPMGKMKDLSSDVELSWPPLGLAEFCGTGWKKELNFLFSSETLKLTAISPLRVFLFWLAFTSVYAQEYLACVFELGE